MHNAIWVEHDGSWTWSIEEGKAFEPGHQVLGRNDGYATRGHAKEAMQAQWAKLIAAGHKPGRPGAVKGGGASSKPEPPVALRTYSGDPPTWAVVVNDKVVALLGDEQSAKQFGQAHFKGKHYVQRVTY